MSDCGEPAAHAQLDFGFDLQSDTLMHRSRESQMLGAFVVALPSGRGSETCVVTEPRPGGSATPITTLSYNFRKDKSSAGDRTKDRKSTRLNSSHLGISYAV